MSEALFVAAYTKLNGPDASEEEQIGKIEELVTAAFPEMPPPDTERLVLDILMAHHHGKDPHEASGAVKLGTSNALSFKSPETLPKVANQSNVAAVRPKVLHSVIDPHKSILKVAPIGGPNHQVTMKSTPFDLLRRVLGEDNSDEEIERALAHNDFHLGRTIDMLAGRSANLELSTEQMAARIICRYFLNGTCLRGSQCMYSHDGSGRLCRFWLQQRCLASESCVFLHEIPQSVTINPVQKAVPLPDLKSLPTLGQKPNHNKPKPQPQPVAATGVQLQPIRAVLGSKREVVPLVPPKYTPWKAPEFGRNAEYVELRKRAYAQAETRNKLLQESTNFWSLNDANRAKQSSARGRDCERQMLELYRKAADLLWEQQIIPMAELWLDLHGLDLTEAIDELESRLTEVANEQKHQPRVLYVITGRGHFKVKKYADRLSQYVCALLDSHGYKHKDFGVHPIYGRVTGVDAWSSLRE